LPPPVSIPVALKRWEKAGAIVGVVRSVDVALLDAAT
jgi:hypothetical protein